MRPLLREPHRLTRPDVKIYLLPHHGDPHSSQKDKGIKVARALTYQSVRRLPGPEAHSNGRTEWVLPQKCPVPPIPFSFVFGTSCSFCVCTYVLKLDPTPCQYDLFNFQSVLVCCRSTITDGRTEFGFLLSTFDIFTTPGRLDDFKRPS